MNVRKNSLYAWIIASRPKTLSAAAVPVMIGAAYSWHITGGEDFGFIPMVLCFLFAFVMQVNANFINDYFDCVTGRDNDARLGPQRATQQGWITLSAMRKAIILTSVFACIVGAPLILYGGWILVCVGLLCLVFCFLYTILLSGIGMGDVLVIVFFGLIPCCFTYYVTVPVSLQNSEKMPWTFAIACGLFVDTLLIINNYRDIDIDKSVGKNTIAVILGKKCTETLFLLVVLIALFLVSYSIGITMLTVVFLFPVLALHIIAWRKMCIIGYGKGLNRILGMTASNILIFGIMTTLLIIMT